MWVCSVLALAEIGDAAWHADRVAAWPALASNRCGRLAPACRRSPVLGSAGPGAESTRVRPAGGHHSDDEGPGGTGTRRHPEHAHWDATPPTVLCHGCWMRRSRADG